LTNDTAAAFYLLLSCLSFRLLQRLVNGTRLPTVAYRRHCHRNGHRRQLGLARGGRWLLLHAEAAEAIEEGVAAALLCIAGGGGGGVSAVSVCGGKKSGCCCSEQRNAYRSFRLKNYNAMISSSYLSSRSIRDRSCRVLSFFSRTFHPHHRSCHIVSS
jgi:hypothetical protein